MNNDVIAIATDGARTTGRLLAVSKVTSYSSLFRLEFAFVFLHFAPRNIGMDPGRGVDWDDQCQCDDCSTTWSV